MGNQSRSSGFAKWVFLLVLLIGVAVVLFIIISDDKQPDSKADLNNQATTQDELLEGLVQISGSTDKVLQINGDLRLNSALIITPQSQPVTPVAGQLYYDENTNELNYYNGTQFVALAGSAAAVNDEDDGDSDSTTAASSSSDIDLPLTVANGGTGATSLAANGVIIGNGTGVLTAVTASAAGLCLTSTSGAPAFTACPGSSGDPFSQGGNSFGATAVLGTNDSNGLNFEVNNSVIASIATTGATSFQNTTNSASGFTVLNALAVPQFTVDTLASRIYIGNSTADSTGALLVLDTKNSSGDPTGLAGALYYNSSLGQSRCYQVDHWQDCGTPTARTTYYYTNDFMSIFADNSVAFDATAGGFATRTAEVSRPSIMYMDTSGSATARLWVVPRTAGGSGMARLGNGDSWRQEIAARIPSGTGLSSGSEPYTFRTGFIDDADASSGNGVDGCFFRYTDSVNSGKWQGVCRNNNSESTCDTTITVATDTWYRLTVVVNAAGDSTDFQINGTSRCQVASNIPTASGRETNWGIALKKDGSGTASRQVEVDYMEVQAQFGTSR